MLEVRGTLFDELIPACSSRRDWLSWRGIAEGSPSASWVSPVDDSTSALVDGSGAAGCEPPDFTSICEFMIDAATSSCLVYIA
jgi:hypothetical protein